MKQMNLVKFSIALMLLGSVATWSHADSTDMSTSMTTSTTTVSGAPGKMWTKTLHINAKVVAVDKTNRTLSVQGPDGNVVDLSVDPSVKRFDAINVGDSIGVDYLESMAIYVQKPGEAPAVSGSASYVVAAKGKYPAGASVTSQQVTATVTTIDYNTRQVTLTGQDGHVQHVKVGPEVKRFNEVKKGDQIVINYTSALAIGVTTPQ